MRAKVLVSPRRGVLDPTGQAVRAGLVQLGFTEVEDVRIGKLIELELGDVPVEVARRRIEEMAERLLVNAVIEDFELQL